MNYLALVKRYWQMHSETAFPPMDSHLYGCLLSIFNGKGKGSDWPDTINLTDGALAGEAGVNFKTIDPARKRLIERGLIEVTTLGKGSRSGAIYRIIDTTLTSPKNGEVATSPITYPKNGEVDSTSPKNGEDNGEVNNEPTLSPLQQPLRYPLQNSEKSHIYIESKHQTPNEETKIIPLTSFEVAQTGTSAFSVVVPNEQENISFVEAELPSSNPHSAPPLSSPVDPVPEPEKPKPPTLEQRIEAFTETVRDFYRANREKYPVELYTNFIRYWTEPTNNQKRFRRETEKTWDLSGRLAYWHENDQKRQFKSNGNPTNSNRQSANFLANQRRSEPAKNGYGQP